jgi:hypothetical protein
MSGKTQFVVGLAMLALGLCLAVGSGLLARSAHGQGSGSMARTANYAVLTGIGGVRQKSQLLYVVDERTEAVYVLEAAAREAERDSVLLRGIYDLRRLSERMQERRAEKDAKAKSKQP